MQGAEVLTKFTADTKDTDKKTDELSKKLGKFAKSMGTAFVSAVGVASVAVVGLLKTSVEAFGEMEQLSGGAKKIFDEMDYSQIEKDAVEAYKTMNMSAREYLSAMNTIGATFAQTMGDKKGYNTAKQGLQAIADYASGTGANINLLTDKFKAITRSTTSYLSIADQFSGLLPQTTDGFLKQAQASGYLAKKYKKLNDVPVAEYQEAISKMLEKGVSDMGLLGNTTAEATETLTGSLASARGAWDNFISGIGSIDDVVSSFISAAKQIGKAVIKLLPIITDGLISVIDGLIPQVPNLIMKLLPSVINGAITLVQGVVELLPTFLSMIGSMLPTIISSLISGFSTAVSTLAEQAPVLIPELVNAIIDALLTLTDPENVDQLIDCGIALMDGLVLGVSNSLPSLIEAVPTIIENFVSAFIVEMPRIKAMGPKIIWALIKGLISAIPSIVLQVPKIIKAIIDGLANGLPQVKDMGKNLIDGLVNGMKGMKDKAVKKAKEIGNSILSGIKDILGIHSPSTEFELVGKYSVLGYTNALDDMSNEVDKQIAKTFTPKITPNLIPNINPISDSTIGSMLASTPTSNITIHNSMEFDALGQLVNNVKTFSGGAKNDYNYVGGY